MRHARLASALRGMVLVSAAWCLAGCGVLEGIRKPTARITDVRLRGITLSAVTLVFDLEVGNPYSVPLPLANVDYHLASEGSKFLSGQADVQGAVPAGGSKTLSLPAPEGLSSGAPAPEAHRAPSPEGQSPAPQSHGGPARRPNRRRKTMIARNRLLELIDKALCGEEQLIALYASHCVLFLDLLEPNRARYEECRGALVELRDDSRRHRDELTELRDAVLAGSDRDAY